jgi:hypothetical protein
MRNASVGHCDCCGREGVLVCAAPNCGCCGAHGHAHPDSEGGASGVFVIDQDASNKDYLVARNAAGSAPWKLIPCASIEKITALSQEPEPVGGKPRTKASITFVDSALTPKPKKAAGLRDVIREYYVNINGCKDPFNLPKRVVDEIPLPDGYLYDSNRIEETTRNPRDGDTSGYQTRLNGRKLEVIYWCNRHPGSACILGFAAGPDSWLGIRVILVVRAP